MKRTVIFLLVLLFVFISGNALAQELEIDYLSDWLVTVSGYAPKPLWLGVTAIIDGREVDYEAKKVNGNFKYSYNCGSDGIQKSYDAPFIWWVASLWEKKIYRCGCEYCKRNGYHLEERVIRAE